MGNRREQDGKPDNRCACIFCKNHREFEFPPFLLEEFTHGRVAIFAGAGVSTEGRTVLRDSLAETIASEMGVDATALAFPDLMEKFSSRPNGRFELIKRIKSRFDYIYSHPELHRLASRFHRELATLFMVDTIVTTNWDTYFEDECHATPFVQPEDVAFWDVADRRVLKIHGTVEHYGSIVATRSVGGDDRKHVEVAYGHQDDCVFWLLCQR